MELSPYVEALRADLAAAAATGTEEVRRAAELLGGALESSTRLVLMDALAAATAEVTAALSGPVVEVRLRGRDPDIVVTQPPAADEPASAAAEAIGVESDGNTVRVTLRLPEPLKSAVEDAATQAALSLNSWLVRAVKQALDQPASSRRRGRTVISGYAQA